MSLFSVLFSLACTSSGTVTLGDGTGVDDTGVVDTGEVEPEPNAAAGDYDGDVTWSMPEWDWTICDMGIDLEIDDEGNFAMDDTCIYYGSQGGEYDLEITIEGSVDEDGEIEGEIEFQSWAIDNDYYVEDFSSELSGETDDDEINLEFFDVADMDRYGEVEIVGLISLER
jgi:hypothetical protein